MFKNTIIAAGLLVTLIMFSTGCSRVNERKIASIQWRKAGVLPENDGKIDHPGLAGPVSGIHSDVLIVGGGANFPDSMPWSGGKKRYHDEIYLFRKNNDIYAPLDKNGFTMPYPAAYGASCTTQRGVLYAGGENESGLIRNVLLIRYEASYGHIVIDRLPDLPFAVANASVATDGTNVYLAGGEIIGGVSDKLLHLDLGASHPSWTTLAPLPHAVSHSVLTLQRDGSQLSLYLMGGRKKNKSSPSSFHATTHRFDLRQNQWSTMASMPYAVSAGTGWSNGDGDIFLFGGDAGNTFNKTEELIASISMETDPSRRKILEQEKAALQAAHPGFSREIFHYDVRLDKWSVSGTMPFDVPVTTNAVEADENEVVIPSGEIRAGVRSPFILQGRLSFKTYH